METPPEGCRATLSPVEADVRRLLNMPAVTTAAALARLLPTDSRKRGVGGDRSMLTSPRALGSGVGLHALLQHRS